MQADGSEKWMRQMDKLAGIDDAVHRYYSQKAVSEDLIEAILYSVNAEVNGFVRWYFWTYWKIWVWSWQRHILIYDVDRDDSRELIHDDL